MEFGYKVSVRVKFHTTRSDVFVSWRVTVDRESGETLYDYKSTRYPPLSMPADMIGPIIPPEIESENRWIAFVLSRLDGKTNRQQIRNTLHAIDPKLSDKFIETVIDKAFLFSRKSNIESASESPELALPERANFLIQSHFDGKLSCEQIAEIVWIEFPVSFTRSRALEHVQRNIGFCVADAIGV